MSIGPLHMSNKRKTKELKVLQLHDQGYSYRKIAREVHLSLREVSKYIHRISNKWESRSTTSVHDEILLEYTVNLLRSEVKDLKIERDSLKNEVYNLRAQKSNIQIQMRTKQSELNTVKRNLECEKFSRELLNDNFIEDQKLH